MLHDGNLHSNKRQRSLLAARQVAHLILIQSHCLRALWRIAVLRDYPSGLMRSAAFSVEAVIEAL